MLKKIEIEIQKSKNVKTETKHSRVFKSENYQNRSKIAARTSDVLRAPGAKKGLPDRFPHSMERGSSISFIFTHGNSRVTLSVETNF